jgi:hypothetical protein
MWWRRRISFTEGDEPSGAGATHARPDRQRRACADRRLASALTGRIPQHTRSLRLILAGVLAASVLPMVPATVAIASNGKPRLPQLVSGPDPLPDVNDSTHCGSAAGTEYDRSGWEQEASIAVNPANPDNLVTAWVQDWSDAIAVGYSTDGGRTWNNVVPPTTKCTPDGNPVYNFSAFDPWLAFGPRSDEHPQGVVYLSSTVLTSPGLGENLRYAQLINRSFDGGKTWSQPYELEAAITPLYLDPSGSNVIADPARPDVAYAVWARGDAVAGTRHLRVSRTADGGESWSVPTEIVSSRLQRAGTVLILPDRSLALVIAEIPPQPDARARGNWRGPTTLMATRSTDEGLTWSVPVEITVADRERVAGATAGVSPDGTIYVSWVRSDTVDGLPRMKLMYAAFRLTDTGLTDKRIDVITDQPGPPERSDSISTAPNLAVAADGTVGIVFYDHRNDPGNSPAKVTDVWFRHSHDGGKSWEEDHLAGPFDHTSAPSNDGGLPYEGPGSLGDYPGIAPMAGGYLTAFVLAEPLKGANFKLGSWSYDRIKTTDIFFVRLTL